MEAVFCAVGTEFYKLLYLYRLGVAVGLSLAQPVSCQVVATG
jgi:hypothetical protein